MPSPRLLVLLGTLTLLATPARAGSAAALDPIAEAYVKLALAAGVHDDGFVDAYFGPPEWRTAAEAARWPLAAVQEQERALAARLAAVSPEGWDGIERLRHEYLTKQLRAMDARLDHVRGVKLNFDEESARLFDAVMPPKDQAHFDATVARLEQLVPGTGSLAERIQAYRKRFLVPAEKIDSVFQAAIAEARQRTRRYLPLPAGESFVVEYVTDKPWGAYNWYKGNAHSVIQVNTSAPFYVGSAIGLACHEGYPGHHVYNALLEEKYLRGRGWVEFSVYPLFSPQSLIAEGTAEYGVSVAFPPAERLAFERDVLFPLAGIDPALAAGYHEFQELMKELAFAGTEGARRYLNGELSAAELDAWNMKYSFRDATEVARSRRFADTYRSYVINYTYGEELVGAYFDRQGASADEESRWRAFGDLISSPRLPSALQ
jgi:hypothetical protein